MNTTFPSFLCSDTRKQSNLFFQQSSLLGNIFSLNRIFQNNLTSDKPSSLFQESEHNAIHFNFYAEKFLK